MQLQQKYKGRIEKKRVNLYFHLRVGCGLKSYSGVIDSWAQGNSDDLVVWDAPKLGFYLLCEEELIGHIAVIETDTKWLFLSWNSLFYEATACMINVTL